MNSSELLDHYIEAALKTAGYEKIEDGVRVYADLPNFRGAWATGNTRDEADRSLRGVLKGWIELELERGRTLPKLERVQTPQLSLA